jgi:hypothetical protein
MLERADPPDSGLKAKSNTHKQCNGNAGMSRNCFSKTEIMPVPSFAKLSLIAIDDPS